MMAFATLLPISMTAKNDPVVMTVNGKDVKLSEFEYLYNKNKQQQLEKQTFDKYVDMFVVYKLKVADAEAAGIDTTNAFINEFRRYRNDLANPYLEDETVEDKLAHEAYDRMKEDVEVSHIMYHLADPKTNSLSKPREFMDSIRNCILNGQDFAELAAKYSIDPSAKRNGGNMGYIKSGLTPYAFEYAAYNTPVGEISEVVESPYGLHLVKPTAKRASRGEVLVEHIMKLFPREATNAQKLELKQRIDSIYTLVKSGADFEEIAKKESDDRGSKTKGGLLPWFGTGQMVPEFETVSFELAKDSISKPFMTSYGYHIVKKLDSRGLPEFEKVKDQIIGTFVNDDRAAQPRLVKLQQLKDKYNYTVVESCKNEILSSIEKAGCLDSAVVAALENSETSVVTFGDRTIKVKDVAKKLQNKTKFTVVQGKAVVERTINSIGDEAVIEYEKDMLEVNDSDYANLVNEYRDGLLLFEISNQKVWNKASADKEGLEEFFKKNVNKYIFEKPKFKGILVQVSNDSIADLVKAEVGKLGKDTLVKSLRKQFKRNIKVEKVLVAKGENKLIDAIGFSRNYDFENPDKKFPVYFVLDGRIIGIPEEASDVRGPVTVDYQNLLEQQWVKELRAKYPVKLNKRNLNKVK